MHARGRVHLKGRSEVDMQCHFNCSYIYMYMHVLVRTMYVGE